MTMSMYTCANMCCQYSFALHTLELPVLTRTAYVHTQVIPGHRKGLFWKIFMCSIHIDAWSDVCEGFSQC